MALPYYFGQWLIQQYKPWCAACQRALYTAAGTGSRWCRTTASHCASVCVCVSMCVCVYVQICRWRRSTPSTLTATCSFRPYSSSYPGNIGPSCSTSSLHYSRNYDDVADLSPSPASSPDDVIMTSSTEMISSRSIPPPPHSQWLIAHSPPHARVPHPRMWRHSGDVTGRMDGLIVCSRWVRLSLW